ncbi:Uma2 family endonuclease [Fibrella sp. HMF5335]|uniref:Uma2 family endonuclease n=1 Tax=Fibrella rubiginis TaxID=2817060 RepID=A0A939GF24_9BACT|nr:Uma2 family endonuclease [Fibrella rubiginis]MBO0937804.1 Uma2 family endonuclease [Fibrella rubiginis]
MVAEQKHLLTEQEYLTLERAALDKSEFYNGERIPIAGASINHNRVKENLNGKIISHLEFADCQSFSSDMRVHFPGTSLYAYPDIVIVCGEPQLLPNEFDNLTNPNAIIEVLSDGTEDYDRGRKFHRYRAIPSLTEYILLDSQTVSVEIWRRNEQGQWTLTHESADPTTVFTIGTIGLSVTLSTVYTRTTGLLPDASAPTTAP